MSNDCADITSIRSLSLRVFSDNSDAMWKASVTDVDGEILCVSQFTLMANTTKNKPDFHKAMVDSQSPLVLKQF
jgi:D-aminoacyl-tRNA deacylase